MVKEEKRESMSVADLILACDRYLRSLGYGKDSVRMYNQIWGRFSRYADMQGQSTFTSAFAEQYLCEMYGITAESVIKKDIGKTLFLRCGGSLISNPAENYTQRKFG